MASGSIPLSSSKETLRDGIKTYDLSADAKWWLYPRATTSMWESSWETIKSQEYAKIKELEGDTSQRKFQDDYYLLITENPDKLFTEMDPQLIRIKKTEPWWQTTDKFDPHTTNSSSGRRFVPDKGLASLEPVSDFFTDSVPRSPDSVPSSPCGLNSTTTPEDEADKLLQLSKAELLEALCHSQTRAREAEKAAKQAYNEKQHLITHFLKQAYKQWPHILQLETTWAPPKMVYTCFPDFVPLGPTKDVKRVRRKVANSKPGLPRDKVSRSFGSFVLGLTVVGVGLLLGWALGWLFR